MRRRSSRPPMPVISPRSSPPPPMPPASSSSVAPGSSPDAPTNTATASSKASARSTPPARPGVLLHPTMIYGAEGEDNVQRLAAVLRRLPIIPLPAGGSALVQPIHQSDVHPQYLSCSRASLDLPRKPGHRRARLPSVMPTSSAPSPAPPALLRPASSPFPPFSYASRPPSPASRSCRAFVAPRSAACSRTKPSTSRPCKLPWALPQSPWPKASPRTFRKPPCP